ncbi:MAG: DUF4363 family protein [Rivularia sp. (in: Bacteria)]|nr:DUF4363 family protein [Rivularia sp. MS3]
MKKFIYVIPVMAIGLLTLVGCTNPQSTTGNSATTETTSATQGSFDDLVTVVSGTRVDVEAGKFEQAQQEFDKFENAWFKVEDGVKTKSSQAYNAIEDAAIQVKGALKAKDKAKALEGLGTIDTNIATVSKG